MKLFYAMKIETTNGSSGQPRRGWLIYDAEGNLQGFADESCRGDGALLSTAAMLAGNQRSRGERVRSGYEANSPQGAVRVNVLGITRVIPGEYTRAKKYGTGDTAGILRQF